MKRLARRSLGGLLLALMALSGRAQPDTERGKAPTTDEASVSIEVCTDRTAFAARLLGRVHVVDFDDIDTSKSDFVSFDSDRYKGMGILIKGTDGQYAGRTFSFPEEYVQSSKPNMYAPGPRAKATARRAEGGHETVVTFVRDGRPASVAGFGAVFIDADYPSLGPSSIAVFGADNELLAVARGFSGGNVSKLFRGMIAVDRSGAPIPAITRVQLINGNCWPEVDTADSEGVILDDFVFATPGERYPSIQDILDDLTRLRRTVVELRAKVDALQAEVSQLKKKQ
ncbi:hypothetical protein ACFL5Q_02685 [Planctomycetota bacterium]